MIHRDNCDVTECCLCLSKALPFSGRRIAATGTTERCSRLHSSSCTENDSDGAEEL